MSELKYIKSSSEKVGEAQKELDDFNSGIINPVIVRHDHVNINTFGGFLPRTINIIGGTSGTGKSYITQEWEEDFLNKVLNKDADEHILLRCNWEMVNRALLVRAIRKQLPNMTLKDIYYSKKSPEVKKIIDDVIAREKSDRIFYFDQALDPHEYLKELKLFLDKFTHKKRIWVTIDHVGLVKGNNKFESINTLIEMLNDVKKDSKYGNVTFIIVMQLNREIEKRSDIRNLAPNRGDFYGSDAVFQAADMVIVAHRPDRMGHEKYLQFNANKYKYLEKYYAPVKGRKVEFRNFITENLVFFHYLKLREEDHTMNDLYVHEMYGQQLEDMNILGDLELASEGNKPTTMAERLAVASEEDELPF